MKEGTKREAENLLEMEIRESKRAKENILDPIVAETPKSYMSLSKQKATAMFRTRSGMLDPKPREPKWNNHWKCAFCWNRSQSSKHYLKECVELDYLFENNEERHEIWQTISTLNGDMEKISRAAEKCKQIHKLIENTD